MPERRNGPETRQSIIDQFSELVAVHGFEEASVSMLATAVGISKGTVVHHFPGKDMILVEAHLQYMTRRVREMYRVLDREHDPPFQLAAMMYCIVRAHRDDRAATISFLREFSRFLFGANTHQLRSLRHEFTSIMTGILRRGEVCGAFTVPDVTLTTLQVFGQCNYVWTWYRPESTASVEDIAATFAANTLRGFLTEGRTEPAPGPKELLEFFTTLQPILEPVYPAVG